MNVENECLDGGKTAQWTVYPFHFVSIPCLSFEVISWI